MIKLFYSKVKVGWYLMHKRRSQAEMTQFNLTKAFAARLHSK